MLFTVPSMTRQWKKSLLAALGYQLCMQAGTGHAHTLGTTSRSVECPSQHTAAIAGCCVKQQLCLKQTAAAAVAAGEQASAAATAAATGSIGRSVADLLHHGPSIDGAGAVSVGMVFPTSLCHKGTLPHMCRLQHTTQPWFH